jgi:hypothetical protein
LGELSWLGFWDFGTSHRKYRIRRLSRVKRTRNDLNWMDNNGRIDF